MKRTTVKLPDELDARLRHQSQACGRTISELTREAIAQYLAGGPDQNGKRHLLAAASGHSGRVDISERIEEILSQEAERSRC